MHRIILFAMVLCLTIIPCHALTLFQTNYDDNIYETEIVYEGEWLPLSNLSEILPYDVEWNAETRTITITAARTFQIRPDWWIPPGVKIENGTTYVTPSYLSGLLGAEAFMYDGELYVFDGEVEKSALIKGKEEFRKGALTTLFRMKLVAPEIYEMVRKNLSGGVQGISREELPSSIPLNILAYVYPYRRNPIAYIVGNTSGVALARRLVHEGVHVRQAREGREIREEEAKQAEREVEGILLGRKQVGVDLVAGD